MNYDPDRERARTHQEHAAGLEARIAAIDLRNVRRQVQTIADNSREPWISESARELAAEIDGMISDHLDTAAKGRAARSRMGGAP